MTNRLKRFLKRHASKKKVIVVNSHDQIELIARVIKGALASFGADTDILCFKSRIPGSFTGFNDRVKISEDYLALDDYVKIDRHVFNDISKNWDKEAKRKFKDFFIYHNIELARIAEYDLQLFLIVKIKALAVISRAIKKENYEAILIIDSNHELGNFDKLSSKFSQIPIELIGINKRERVKDTVRKAAASIISGFLDGIASLLIRRRKLAKLIDARLFYQLGIKNKESFVLAPFEEGLRLRLKCLLKNSGYVAFKLGSRARSLRPIPESLRNQFIFEGLPYWELVEKRMKMLIWNDFKRYRKNIDTLFKTRNIFNIKSIVLRNDVRELEKTVVLSSKEVGIKTLVIQHGILAEPNGHNTIFADKIALWGDCSVRWYQRYGNDSSKMVVVGNPNFDRLFAPLEGPASLERLPAQRGIAKFLMGRGLLTGFVGKNFSDKKRPQEDLGLKKNRYLITLITTGISMLRLSAFVTDDITENIIRDVASVVRSIGGCNLIVKLHPNEDVIFFKRLLTEEDRISMAITDRIDLYKLITSSNLVITIDSSVALEAIIIGKQVVVINLSKREDLVPYAQRNVAVGVYNSIEIKETINKVLHDERVKKSMEDARKDFVDYFIYKNDGNASKRVLELIKDF